MTETLLPGGSAPELRPEFVAHLGDYIRFAHNTSSGIGYDDEIADMDALAAFIEYHQKRQPRRNPFDEVLAGAAAEVEAALPAGLIVDINDGSIDVYEGTEGDDLYDEDFRFAVTWNGDVGGGLVWGARFVDAATTHDSDHTTPAEATTAALAVIEAARVG